MARLVVLPGAFESHLPLFDCLYDCLSYLFLALILDLESQVEYQIALLYLVSTFVKSSLADNQALS